MQPAGAFEDTAQMASTPQDTLFIAGAGIGGLTAAIALSRRARPVTVLEAAPRLIPSAPGCNCRQTPYMCCAVSGWRKRFAGKQSPPRRSA